MHARLTAAGYPSNLAPFDAFWGSRYAIVEGPSLMVKPPSCEYVPLMLLQSALPVNVPSVLKMMV